MSVLQLAFLISFLSSINWRDSKSFNSFPRLPTGFKRGHIFVVNGSHAFYFKFSTLSFGQHVKTTKVQPFPWLNNLYNELLYVEKCIALFPVIYLNAFPSSSFALGSELCESLGIKLVNKLLELLKLNFTQLHAWNLSSNVVDGITKEHNVIRLLKWWMLIIWTVWVRA